VSPFGRRAHASGTAPGSTAAPGSWGTLSAPMARSWQQGEVSPDLQALDPGFDVVPFVAMAEATFRDFAVGWADGKLAALVGRFDEELLSKLQAQLDYAASGGVRPRTARIDALASTVISASVANGERARVRFEVTGLSVDRCLPTGEEVPRTELVQWVEFWTFVRPLGAVAKLAPVQCPTCNAPLPPGAGICHYCGGRVAEDSAGWIVSHIEDYR